MNTLVAICVLLSGGAVTVDIAPDQPLPWVYVDDPLIIELASDRDLTARARVRVHAGYHGEAHEVELGPFALHAQANRWCPVEGIPKERGFYGIRVEINAEGLSTEATGQFCRIDRLAHANNLPLCAYAAPLDRFGLLALEAVAVRTLRLDAATDDLDQRLEAVIERGFDCVLALDTAETPTERAAEIARRFAPHIVRWDIAAGARVPEIAALLEGLREAGSTAPVAVEVSDVAAFRALLAEGLGRHTRAALVGMAGDAPVALAPFFRAAESECGEGWRLFARDYAEHEAGFEIVRRLLDALADGAQSLEFATPLAAAGQVSPGVAYLNALAQRLKCTRYAGELPAPEDVRAMVFRDGAQWLVTVQTDGADRAGRCAARGLRLRVADHAQRCGHEGVLLRLDRVEDMITAQHQGDDGGIGAGNEEGFDGAFGGQAEVCTEVADAAHARRGHAAQGFASSRALRARVRR